MIYCKKEENKVMLETCLKKEMLRSIAVNVS